MNRMPEAAANFERDLPRMMLAEFFSLILQDFRSYQRRLRHTSFLKSLVLLFLFHSGFQLIFSIRLQRQIVRLPLIGALLRRVLWYLTSIWTGTEINIQARFGAGVYFPHPTGVVIGEAWDIAEGVTIMQGVTLGQRDELKPVRRSKVAANSIICAGAVVVGEIFVGENAVIGANAVVLCDVPANATVVGVPARVIEKSS